MQDLHAQIERQARDISGLVDARAGQLCGGKENLVRLQCLPGSAGAGMAPIASQCHKLHSALQKLDRLRQARVSAAEAASASPAMQVRRHRKRLSAEYVGLVRAALGAHCAERLCQRATLCCKVCARKTHRHLGAGQACASGSAISSRNRNSPAAPWGTRLGVRGRAGHTCAEPVGAGGIHTQLCRA